MLLRRLYRRYFAPVDLLTAALIVLLVVVQVGALWVAADPLQKTDPPPVVSSESQTAPGGGGSGTTDAGTGVSMLAVLLVEAAILYGLYWLVKRLPAWVRRWLKRAGVVGLGLYLVAYAALILPALFVVYGAIAALWYRGHEWLAFDLAAVVLGILVAATLGGMLAPVPIIIVLTGLLVYDYLAVSHSDVMGTFVELAADWRIPAFIVIPRTLDFELGEVLAALRDPETSGTPADVLLVVGVGDFAIPAALVVSAVIAYASDWPALAAFAGLVVAMVALRAAVAGEKGETPGLPWLNTGVMCGFGVGLLIAVVTAM